MCIRDRVNYSKEMLQLYFQNEDPDFDLLFDSPEDGPVSYTHLDVYKRQISHFSFVCQVLFSKLFK